MCNKFNNICLGIIILVVLYAVVRGFCWIWQGGGEEFVIGFWVLVLAIFGYTLRWEK
uniref:DUF5668 domain-containing protein n=1 Tax=viral metagenome TaxID=1070528 RepID=A0A6M3IXS0_9ZZZZ